jgi:hypothetical protein
MTRGPLHLPTTWLVAAEMLRSIYKYTAYSWLVMALAGIISEICGAIIVGIEVLTDPTI